MPVTMRDVSAMAGVSISTVSHVVNNTRAVPEMTRQRVLDAIKATGFLPNTVARSLKRAETRTLGVAIGDISNPFFAEVVHAVEAAARAAGYTVILTDFGEDAEREMAALRALVGRRVDGMILAPSGAGGAEAVAYVRRQGIPLVQVDRVAARGCDSVLASNVPDMRRLVRHLARLGHRRIAVLTGVPGLSSTRERIAGFRAGMKDAGIEPDPALIVPGEFSSEPARAAARALMARPDRPTAIVATNNLMALGAMRALHELGLRVPADIALVSFDDFEWADLFQPRLTTIAQPCARIGDMAVRLLLARIAAPDARPQHVRLPTELKHRESCGCASDAGPIQ